MRRIFTLLSFLLLPLLGMSQLRVVEGSFKEIPGFVDMSEKTDDNNKPFAVVIIKTLNINEQERAKLRFSSDAMSYVEVEYRVGEVWLYVSYYASFLKIKHPDLSSAPDFYLPFDMQPRHGYELVLEKYNVAPAPDAQTINYLIVRCDQPDASICIDGSFVGMKEGSKALGVGEKHSWQIDCGLYHSESGEVTITEGEPVTVERNLRPAYGFLKVTSSPENGATVFINNNKVGTTPYTSERLQSGSYNVRVMKEMFSLSEKSFLVKDNETTVANMVLNPNFATLSLNTDPASDIFIDGERVAKGQWNGRLSSGTHLVEARKPSHRNSSLKVNLSNGENKTVTIPNPEPIYSMLDINSQPMGAKILIDGEDFGTTPRVIKNILVGEHTLSLVKQGCAKLEKTFTLKEKEMLSLNEKLESGKIITVTTDREGDEIYVDGTFAGHSPLDVSMGYGRHTVKAIRNGRSVMKDIDVKINGTQTQLTLEFGKIITITTDKEGDAIYVDGKLAGQSPLSIDLSFGSHDIKSVRDKKSDEKRIEVKKDGGVSSVSLYLRAETAANYVRNGITFVTANASVSNYGTPSFGVTFGKVKKVGWFVSATTNFNFQKAELVTENGLIDGNFPGYQQGSRRNSRLSLLGGVVVKLYGPLCFRAGAGYGSNTTLWTTLGGQTVKFSTDSFSGIEATLGMQLNIKGLTVSLDMLTTNFKTLEAKIGVGVCFKNKR